MSPQPYIHRFIQERLEEALTDNPVVLIHGPRQSGKTTLALRVGREKGYAYYSFDDVVVLAAAKEDPVGFVAGLPDRVILDEIQRVPDLFATIKLAVDRDRSPGRFILTGSANILLIPRLSDSLAGRIEIIRLHPLSRCEVMGRKSGFLDALFGVGEVSFHAERIGDEIAEIVAAGGYPAALARSSNRRRASWYRGYIETITQKDIKDLARIKGLDSLPQLLALVAAQTAQLFNQSELAGPFRLSRPTIGEYVTLLERVFLVNRLAPWHSNRVSRLIKTPKIHVGDTGVACVLLGLTPDALRRDRKLLGQLLETYVVQELRRQASWNEQPVRFYHFRNKDGVEVDVVLERGPGQIAGIEVKLSGTVIGRDFRGLRKLQDGVGDRFVMGVVLYDGEDTIHFGDRLVAVPLKRLWEQVSLPFNPSGAIEAL